MKNLTGWAVSAAEKLDREKKDITENKAKAMADPVAEALKDFCRQSTDFAKAVVEGGSFHACMKEVANGVGSYISDLDAYKKAVLYYFPKATVEMTMTIHTEKEPEKKTGTGVILDLTQFLGM